MRRPSARKLPGFPPRLLVAQRARFLDERIGKAGDIADHASLREEGQPFDKLRVNGFCKIRIGPFGLSLSKLCLFSVLAELVLDQL